jgi:pimeloyl-ACP methyl ester carboxylesterase
MAALSLVALAGALDGCAASGTRMDGECLHVPIYYCTMRQDTRAGEPERRFANDRSEPPVQCRGCCTVLVPLSRRTYSGIDAEAVAGRPHHTAKQEPALSLAPCGSDGVWVPAPGEGEGAAAHDIVLYVHGFNNSFEDAVMRAAVIGSDVATGQRMACFDWASRGRVYDYCADEATVEASERQLAECLAGLEAMLNSEGHDGRVHILAHSMGSRLACRAIDRLAQYPGHHFGQLMLAAPDVDEENFRDISAELLRVVKGITVYRSSHDRAVATSGVLHKYPRLGFASEQLKQTTTPIPGVDMVIVDIDGSLKRKDPLGHAFFVIYAPVLADLRQALIGRPAASDDRHLKQVVAPAADGHSGVWRLEIPA